MPDPLELRDETIHDLEVKEKIQPMSRYLTKWWWYGRMVRKDHPSSKSFTSGLPIDKSFM